MSSQETLYSSFNARNLSPEQVASSFVPHSSFNQLLGNDHVVLMGPRGSGKTTMFKMLTTRALRAWNHSDKDKVVERIPFAAIYIPTDIHWKQQLSHLEGRLNRFPDFAHIIAKAAVTNNVLNALCATIGDRLRHPDEADDLTPQEERICKRMITEWHLGPTLPCIEGVIDRLHSRTNQLSIMCERLLITGSVAEQAKSLPDWLFLDYLSAAGVICHIFDETLPALSTKRWALCFDELELSPDWLQKRLLGELRSSDEQFLFKLSTSPIPSFIQETEASPLNDYREIKLWPHTQTDNHQFCEDLTSAFLERKGVSNTPANYFGKSAISEENISETQNEYGRGSENWRILKEAARRDRTLWDLLLFKGINPDDPATDDMTKRDQVLRKVKPTAWLRMEFRKSDLSGAPGMRPRKNASIYSGSEAIYDISDGNPRRLIGILSDMLAIWERKKDQAMPPCVQSRVLYQTAHKFKALTQALPYANVSDLQRGVTMFQLLDQLGSYFAKRILEDSFPLDPVGSFVIDDKTPPLVIDLLKTAAYHGAIIYVDDVTSITNSEMVGKRFRLSYLWAPLFRLPLRLYTAVPLSSCLQPMLADPKVATIRQKNRKM